MTRLRPFALIISGAGVQMVIGPLDNHPGAGGGLEADSLWTWALEAADQLPESFDVCKVRPYWAEAPC